MDEYAFQSMPCEAMLYYAVLYYAMICYAVQSCSMLCYVMARLMPGKAKVRCARIDLAWLG